MTTTELATDVQRRVARGAALLDQVAPRWFIDIDPYQIDLDSCTRCVLGRLYGHLQDGLTELAPDIDRDDTQARYEFARDHGFDTDGLGSGGQDFPDLTTAWVDEIQVRRWAATARPLRAVVDGDPWKSVTA